MIEDVQEISGRVIARSCTLQYHFGKRQRQRSLRARQRQDRRGQNPGFRIFCARAYSADIAGLKPSETTDLRRTASVWPSPLPTGASCGEARSSRLIA